jgi:hypothetical protein
MSDSTNTAVSSDGVEISFNKQGKGKPALVFVHGCANNKTIWDAPDEFNGLLEESLQEIL